MPWWLTHRTVRAPCPGCNTLANHGFINRNGLGISAQQLIDGFSQAFNMDASVTTVGANNAINLCSQITGTQCQTFDLWMLDTPHAIEHDGSLTRSDRQETWKGAGVDNDNFRFNTTRWTQSLSAWGAEDHIDISLANSARVLRNSIQQADDVPGWFLQNDGGTLTEHGFFLTAMEDRTVSQAQGNPGSVQARADWIAHWFEVEELPTALGWVRPTQVIDGNYVNAVSAAVGGAPTQPPPPGTRPIGPNPIATNDKRSIALDNLLAEPSGVSAYSSAAAVASATAGPKPVLRNLYKEDLAPDAIGAQVAAAKNYVNKYVDTLSDLLDLTPP